MSEYHISFDLPPPLNPSEQLRLARLWTDHSDLESRNKLVVHNLRFVLSTVKRFAHGRSEAEVDDLFMAGVEGLMIGIDQYDPESGYSLLTYSRWWIRCKIIEQLGQDASILKVATTRSGRTYLNGVHKTRRLLQERGEAESDENMAEALGLTLDDYRKAKAACGPATDIDDCIGISNFIDDESSLVEMIDQKKKLDRIKEFGHTLTGHKATVFWERIAAVDPMLFSELSEQYETDRGNKVSKQRWQQIEAVVLDMCREFCLSELNSTET